MLPRLLPSLALVLVLLAPGALAFPALTDPVDVRFEGALPTVLAVGAVGMEGPVEAPLALFDVRGFRLEGIPMLTVAMVENGRPANATHRNVDLVVHDGTLLWRPERGEVAPSFSADYGIALALPKSPFAEEGAPGGGFLLGGPGLHGTLDAQGTAELVLLDANATLLQGGKPVPGWERRHVNAGQRDPDAPDRSGLVLRAEGRFTGAGNATLVGGGLDGGSDVRLSVAPSSEDRFAEALAAVGDALARMQGEARQGGEDPFGPGSPLQGLDALSPLLNGVLLVFKGEGAEAADDPVVATMGGKDLELGPVTVLRAKDMEMRLSSDATGIQGTPALAVTRAGFAVPPTASVAGIVPILSLVLWAVALGAILVFVVRRPQEAKSPWEWRVLGWGAQAAALGLAFWLWDRSFAASFGTSFLTMLAEHGFDGGQMPRMLMVLGVELVPWSIAALFFALPVRIAAGVGLRYFGKGKALKGFAKAAGYVVLGILGPLYALWLMNVLVGQMLAMLPALGQ